MNFKLGRDYSLKSRKEIDAIFENGNRITAYPFIAFVVQKEFEEQEHPFKIVFSAPKKTFRRAHERNRIKRVMREVVRLNKTKFEKELEQHHKYLNIFLIYSSKEELKQEILHKKINKLFTKIINSLHE